MRVTNRSGRRGVALETTLLLHGVPHHACMGLAEELAADVAAGGSEAALVGVVAGEAIVGMNRAELAGLLAAAVQGPEGGDGRASGVAKANTSNLGVLLARKQHAATTVSTTMELAAAAGVRVFATGGLGGVHQGWTRVPDISADLLAMTRFGVAVVASGVKSLLDVRATREALETLGVPVVGYQTDEFPAFYLRRCFPDESVGVDARFDDVAALAQYLDRELTRTGRGVLVVQGIPHEHELDRADFERWLEQARRHVEGQAGSRGSGRGVTPALLGALHMISAGATLRANVALVRANARLAGQLRAAMEV